MKFSKLYSNKPGFFAPIHFRPGLNVVIAEIRLPENKNKDTHNLGKTTLGIVLDYCLLARGKGLFLFKHLDRFSGLVFFLEIELSEGSYLTVRRGVDQPTLISFKYHATRSQDYTTLDQADWDHHDLTFDKAKELLDGVLDLRDLTPWPYRKVIGYLLRSQDDYREVFQLRKFQSRHIDWKPFLAHILGFDGTLVEKHYEKEHKLKEKENDAAVIRNELGGAVEDISKIDGLLIIKRRESEKRRTFLDTFDFRTPDKEQTKRVVDDIDLRIAALNTERYRLSASRRQINSAIEEEQILFNPEEARILFDQAGVLFEGQIKRDFEQLIQFNRAITEERGEYLREERERIDAELKRVTQELNSLGKARSDALSFLSTTDIFNKYKQATDDLVALRTDIVSLERQKEGLHRLQEKRAEIRTLADEKEKLRALVEDNVAEVTDADSTSIFSSMRLYFSEIVQEVINRNALLRVYTNSEGHLEFRADILDDAGNDTSADLGNTYRKLLCVAFDLALARAHLNGRFPRFVYHDGVFENLDPRKKQKMHGVLRLYTELGIQSIITLLDSDIPSLEGERAFSDEEIVLLLHDEGDEGRLFKGPSW